MSGSRADGKSCSRPHWPCARLSLFEAVSGCAVVHAAGKGDPSLPVITPPRPERTPQSRRGAPRLQQEEQRAGCNPLAATLDPRATTWGRSSIGKHPAAAAAGQNKQNKRQTTRSAAAAAAAPPARPPACCISPGHTRTKPSSAAPTGDVVGGQQLAICIPAALLGTHRLHVHRHRWHDCEEAVLARRQACGEKRPLQGVGE